MLPQQNNPRGRVKCCNVLYKLGTFQLLLCNHEVIRASCLLNDAVDFMLPACNSSTWLSTIQRHAKKNVQLIRLLSFIIILPSENMIPRFGIIQRTLFVWSWLQILCFRLVEKLVSGKLSIFIHIQSHIQVRRGWTDWHFIKKYFLIVNIREHSINSRVTYQ